MIVAYTDHPGARLPRPLLDVTVADMSDLGIVCLVDSGAVNTLLPAWVARFGGVDLGDAVERDLMVAASTISAAFVTVRLGLGDSVWEAPVGFCDPWPYDWGVLGHDAFFRFFTVIFRGADGEFEVVPIDH